MQTHVLPTLGDMDVATIRASDVKASLEKIWHAMPATADKLIFNIGVVFDYAEQAEYRRERNPTDAARGLLGPRSREASRKEHHAALSHAAIHRFVTELRSWSAEGNTAHALEFLILCASRDAEASGAVWSEVDMATRTWVIPPHRHKAGKTAKDPFPHIVPLSARAFEIVKAQAEKYPDHKPGDFIFPGGSKSKARRGMLSENTFAKLSRSISKHLGTGHVTAHGFRATFRTWAAEQPNVPGDLAEMCLAHSVGTETTRAYNRSDQLHKRRALLDQWSKHVATQPADAGSNVIEGEFGRPREVSA